MDFQDINSVSVSEIEETLLQNADMANSNKGILTQNSLDLLSLPTDIIALPFVPIIGAIIGGFAGTAICKSFWGKLGMTFLGLGIGTILTPIIAIAVVAKTIKNVISLPLALLFELPRFAFSKKYRTEVKLVKALKKLKTINESIKENEEKDTNIRFLFTKLNDLKFHSEETRTLLSEIQILNKQLNRDNSFVVNSLKEEAFRIKQEETFKSSKTYDFITESQEKDTKTQDDEDDLFQ